MEGQSNQRDFLYPEGPSRPEMPDDPSRAKTCWKGRMRRTAGGTGTYLLITEGVATMQQERGCIHRD